VIDFLLQELSITHSLLSGSKPVTKAAWADPSSAELGAA
jgi:hypothetical protein